MLTLSPVQNCADLGPVWRHYAAASFVKRGASAVPSAASVPKNVVRVVVKHKDVTTSRRRGRWGALPFFSYNLWARSGIFDD